MAKFWRSTTRPYFIAGSRQFCFVPQHQDQRTQAGRFTTMQLSITFSKPHTYRWLDFIVFYWHVELISASDDCTEKTQWAFEKVDEIRAAAETSLAGQQERKCL